MENKWTEEQNKAITERGRNILVSAGAGSGKTAVMVERAVRLIIDDRVPVSAMLIVTFTKAAASEMKDRIRKSLKDELAKASMAGDHEKSGWIREQIDSLQTARISTIHAFAQQILKEFFYLTDIEPGFRVLDEAEAEVLKEQALDELFESEYEEDSPEFRHFLDAYAKETSDNGARTMIRELYTKLEAVPGRFDVLDQKIEELKRSTDEFKESDSFEKMKSLVVTETKNARELAVNTAEFFCEQGLERIAGLIQEDIQFLDEVISVEESGDLDRATELLRTHTYVRMSTRKDEKETYNSIKKITDSMRNDYKDVSKRVSSLYYDTLDRMTAAVRMSYDDAAELGRLEKKFDAKYKELKRDINAIDYSDMEHYSLAILQNDEARKYYRDSFEYIFVDEYQDTNVMQETIISSIARENNRFMVGDIKQSIYHFRLADPDIFKGKYAAYKEEGLKGDDAESIKIDLNRNFRSKAKVIDEINKMFRPLMDGYDKDAELVCGVDSDDSVCGDALPAPETHVVDLAGVEELDEEIQDMQKEELEASEAAEIIQSVLDKEYVDSKSGEVRKINYSDIVIVMRSVKRSAEGYRQVFRKKGIPLYIDDRAGYFDTIEINVFMSLLSVIDNKRQDIPFLAVLRSEIFGFSCGELAEIRKLHRDGTFVSAAEAVSNDENAPEELRLKCRNVFESIRKWQAYAVTLPLPDLIWRLMNETGYYIIAGALPNGAARQANLRLLADRARQYADRSFGSLYGFIQYINTVKASNVDAPQATLLSENDNVVRMMTIHHSKGLEFPVVILGGMDYRQTGNGTPSVLFDSKEGLGIRTIDTKRHLEEKGLVARLIEAKENRYDVEELQRILYVAVTRARETFFLLGTAKYESIEEGLETGHHSDSTFLRMSRYLPHLVRIDPENFGSAFDEDDEDFEEEPERSIKDDEFVEKRLGFRYPHEQAWELAAKTTVTSLNKEGLRSKASWGEEAAESANASVRQLQDEEETESAEEKNILPEEIVPEFIKGKEKMTAAYRGTIYHRVMKDLDFVRASADGTEYIKQHMDELVRSGVFTEEEIGTVSPDVIYGFFDTALGKRAAAAAERDSLYREQTFELKIDFDGEDVLVQGVIDCYFEEDNKIILLDYKTNWLDKSRLEEEKKRVKEMYRTQLDVYSEALEKALGKTVSERYLYLFSINEELEVR